MKDAEGQNAWKGGGWGGRGEVYYILKLFSSSSSCHTPSNSRSAASLVLGAHFP